MQPVPLPAKKVEEGPILVDMVKGDVSRRPPLGKNIAKLSPAYRSSPEKELERQVVEGSVEGSVLKR